MVFSSPFTASDIKMTLFTDHLIDEFSIYSKKLSQILQHIFNKQIHSQQTKQVNDSTNFYNSS